MSVIVPATPHAIADAARVLVHGGLVGFPTETVYGLGADASNSDAVARIFAAKGRPQFNPLIAHVGDSDLARQVGVFDEQAYKLAAAFWPGPLTLVVPAVEACSVCELARAGLPTVALRVPSHLVALELLHVFGGVVVAPSANRSGHVSPTLAEHVQEDLGDQVDLILDGGPCSVGLESTIIACLEGRVRLLRQGGISRHVLEDVLGAPLERVSGAHDPLIAPGMMLSHYAPRTPLRLNALEVEADEAALVFGSHLPKGALSCRALLNLSQTGDIVEAASHFYACLRTLDGVGAARIAVAPLPKEGLGEALHDRLERACR